jgi:YD repeat-containing protein
VAEGAARREQVERLTSRQFGGGQTTLRLDIACNQDNQTSTLTRFTGLGGTSKAASATYTHDNGGRLTHLQQLNGSNANISNFTYTYDPASRLTAEQLNGMTTSYGYLDSGELTQAGTATFGYDPAGNRNSTGYQTGTENQMTNTSVRPRRSSTLAD